MDRGKKIDLAGQKLCFFHYGTFGQYNAVTEFISFKINLSFCLDKSTVLLQSGLDILGHRGQGELPYPGQDAIR